MALCEFHLTCFDFFPFPTYYFFSRLLLFDIHPGGDDDEAEHVAWREVYYSLLAMFSFVFQKFINMKVGEKERKTEMDMDMDLKKKRNDYHTTHANIQDCHWI